MATARKTLCALGLTFIGCSFSYAQKPELVIQTSHTHFVSAVAFSPRNNIVASGGKDKTIKLWDAGSGRQLATLSQPDEVWTVAFSPDGKILASGSNDKTIRLWDIATGRQLRTSCGHTAPVYSVAFSPDGQTLASGSWDKTIKLWNVATGQELRTLTGHATFVNSVAFSPDGKMLASGSGQPRIAGAESGAKDAEDNTIRLWDCASGKELRAFSGHTDAVNAIAFSPDGTRLISGSSDKTLNLWTIETGKLLRALRGHASSVEAVAYSPDGRTLISAGEDIKIWDAGDGKLLRALPKFSASVAFNPGGDTLASAGYAEVALWDVSTGKIRRTLAGYSRPVNNIAYSLDGRTLACAGDDLKLWNLATGQPRYTPNIHHPLANAVAFSPDGKMLASGGQDAMIKLWDIDAGKELRALKGHLDQINSVVFSPDGKILASGSGGVAIEGLREAGRDDNSVKLWDAATGQELRTLPGYALPVYAVAFSPDGKTLASGSGDGRVKLWAVSNGQELRTLKWYISAVLAVAFSPDGRVLASGNGSSILLWDLKTGKILNKLEELANESSADDIDDLYAPELLIAPTATKGCAVDLRWITALAFSPDGKTLASGSADNALKLWDVAAGKVLRTFTGHTNFIKSVAFSPNGLVLASASIDTQTKLWDARSGEELVSLISSEQADWLVVTPDGLFDGSPTAWNQILWRFSSNILDAAPVEIFFNEFYYPGLLADIFAGKRPAATQDIARKDRRQPQLQLALAGAADAAPEISARNVTVQISVANAPAGARDVRLFRNGSLVQVWRGDVLIGQRETTLEATIPIVAGENRLTAYAFNRDNIKSSDTTLALKGAANLKRAGTAHLFVIGVGRYANAQYNLNYAVADAQAFGEQFKRQQDKLGRYQAIEVVPLLNQAATKANILLALKRLAGDESQQLPVGAPKALAQLTPAQPEDAVVVYFSGHGTAARQTERFYLIPSDLGYTGLRQALDAHGLRTILAHSISDVELEAAFRAVDAGQILLVIDACNSGQALEAEEKRRGPMNSKGLAQLAYEKGMSILTAAQSFEVAFESEALKHSYLTYALVEEGLKTGVADSAPRDGQVLLREWLDYATERVPKMRQEKLRQGKQLEEVNPAEARVQRPRVFYRREIDPQPFTVAAYAVAKSQ